MTRPESTETGAPTALMELAYRLVVDDHEYIKSIRNNLVTLITPVVEVDGRDKMVDLYKWHLAHPGQNWPSLIYWGKYVAHDNNRDAMGMTLKLTENPDILSSVAHRTSGRPRLVVGFAAETHDVVANAQAKRMKKGCDWIVANDVSAKSGVMGGDTNTVHLVTASGVESWPPQAKDLVARTLVERIAVALDGRER